MTSRILLDHAQTSTRSTEEKLVVVCVCFFGFLGSQRFLLADFYAYCCLGVLGLSLLFSKREYFFSAFVFSLFLAVDNGGDSYGETWGPIRYGLYVAALAFMCIGSTFSKRTVLLYFCWVGLLIGGTLIQHDRMDATTFTRDLTLLLVVGVALGYTNSRFDFIQLNLGLLSLWIFSYILGEIVNILFFFEVRTDYLNLDTTKCLVCIPFLYLLTRRWYVWSLVVLIPTMYVLVHFQARMIPITLVFLILPVLFYRIIESRKILLGFFSLLTVSILVVQLISNLEVLQGYRVFYTILQLRDSSDFADVLAVADPVRFAENQLFFERDVLQILFGQGLGSGMVDKSGYLNFVMPGTHAFSNLELNAQVYYNLHDVWTDFGLRLGLVPLLLFLSPLILLQFSEDPNTSFYSMMLIMLFFTAFYSTIGMLLIGIGIILLKNSRRRAAGDSVRT